MRKRYSQVFWLLFGLALSSLTLWGLVKVYDRPLTPAQAVERARIRQESDARLPIAQVLTGFEGSESLPVVKRSDAHFEIDVGGEFRHWFMFKLVGVSGRAVRIDLKGAPGKWATLNPVYCYANDLSSAASFRSSLTKQLTLIATHNGSTVPETTGIQNWHFIQQVWEENDKLCFVQSFEREPVYVAMRYPAPPSVVADMFATYAQLGNAEVVTLGKSREGRSIQAVVVGDPVAAPNANKPCIVIYGREHPAEQDPAWVIDGAIRHVTLAAPDAIRLRGQFNFIFLPLVDPDGSATGRFVRVEPTYRAFTETPESVLIADFFETWARSGGRIDIVLNLHNVESSEGTHMFCPQLEGIGETALAHARNLHDQIVRGARTLGFDVEPMPRRRPGFSEFRLGGWLARTYGALHLPYEVNSQAPSRHLTLAQLRQLGEALAISSTEFLDSEQGKLFRTQVDEKRHRRRAEWQSRGASLTQANIIRMESELLYQIETRDAQP